MSTTKKDPNDAVKMTSGLDDQMQADLDEVMRKYDRESNTRVWEGWQRWRGQASSWLHSACTASA